ncbi:MAG: hypothetical protein K0S47_4260 [Herbinix sp.]|jgi:pyruvyl transferase EpsI|nr:hypothetical protein [Herbinix sp.]MDF2842118.1 hypothetical protein [Herbinix sp.]
MWIEKIIHRKYSFNGYNNPTDFILGLFRIRSTFSARKKNVKRIYFTGLPEHGNLGDQAIAYTIIEYAKRTYPDYEIFTFNISEFLDCLIPIKSDCKKDDIFFLIGGGNMGIEYFGNEEVRRIIIEAFPRNKIIIFPQTIDYGKSAKGMSELKNAIKIYNKHKNLTIFAREKMSYRMMKKAFVQNQVFLSPDIVFKLDYNAIYERNQVLMVIRNDRESTLDKKGMELIQGALKDMGSIKYLDTVLPDVPIITSQSMREKLVFRMLDEFSRSRLIITDRLHGMIFSVITNSPCIVIKNYNHKVISSYHTWLRDFENVYYLYDINDIHTAIEEVMKPYSNKKELVKLRNRYKSMLENL